MGGFKGPHAEMLEAKSRNTILRKRERKNAVGGRNITTERRVKARAGVDSD
jgi:hypothetical protein